MEVGCEKAEVDLTENNPLLKESAADLENGTKEPVVVVFDDDSGVKCINYVKTGSVCVVQINGGRSSFKGPRLLPS